MLWPLWLSEAWFRVTTLYMWISGGLLDYMITSETSFAILAPSRPVVIVYRSFRKPFITQHTFKASKLLPTRCNPYSILKRHFAQLLIPVSLDFRSINFAYASINSHNSKKPYAAIGKIEKGICQSPHKRHQLRNINEAPELILKNVCLGVNKSHTPLNICTAFIWTEKISEELWARILQVRKEVNSAPMTTISRPD